jgi:hypothetical protein
LEVDLPAHARRNSPLYARCVMPGFLPGDAIAAVNDRP